MCDKQKLKNICKFPSILGGKLRLSNTNSISENDELNLPSEDFVDKKFFFSGNSVVVEKSREISSFDILLLLQIIEFHQKYKSESIVTDSDLYEHTYDEKEKGKYLDYIKSYCQNEGKEAYQVASKTAATKSKFLADLVQAKVDEENTKNFQIYANTKDSYEINIDVVDLLKARGLRNQIENRKIVEKSLKRLFGTQLTYYFLDKTLQDKIKVLKRNKHYIDWRDEVKDCFYKNTHKSTRFYKHVLESMSVDNDIKTIKVVINKGFLDFCDSARYFNFDKLVKIKSESAKAFYMNSCFSYKETLTKEYVYDLMDLNSVRDDNNLAKAKKAIQELKDLSFLTSDSEYDRKTKMFNLKFTEEEAKRQGLSQKKRYSKTGTKK